jgi:cell filamentation protein
VSGDPYGYPGTAILKNKLGIRNQDKLDYHERELVAQRISQGVPTGNFDMAHLRAIHRHLFQDIYEWAGELRTLEISKGREQFQFLKYIETGMADVHQRLQRANYLKGLSASEFCRKAAEILGDVNYVHPFREGNGRTQLQYLKLFAEQAGHPIDLTQIPTRGWIEASRAAHQADYEPMRQAIKAVLIAASPAEK